jgi:hypothetical protein
MRSRNHTPSVIIAVAVAVITGLIAATGVGAQATPSPDVARPAHIHAGACPDVGDVVFPLNDLTPAIGPNTLGEGTPVASPAAMIETTGDVVAESTTDVEASLDDILAAEHAINVHESAEMIDVYIACGDVTGTATDGELHIQLEELNGSGFAGEAHLVDNGDGTTTVTVTLMVSTGATPVATPAG